MIRIVLIFIFGTVVGGLAVWIFLSLIRTNKRVDDDVARNKAPGLIESQAKEKEENKKRILGILETQSPLTNNHIEQLLGISDATATRYLEELEKEGHVRQIGKTGRQVYYERV